MRALAIVGRRSKAEHSFPFQKQAAESGVDFQVLHRPEVSEVDFAIVSSLPDVILIFGGDGTLNRYLEVLVRTQIPLLMVPTGSGNDFAAVNGTRSFSNAITLWQNFLASQARVIKTDLAAIQLVSGVTRYFSCCGNIGLDADAAERANRLPVWLKSTAGYFLSGGMAILHYEPKLLTIGGEDGVPKISERGWLVSISNTPVFGGGLKIAPQASIVDGKLDVTFVHQIPRWKLMWHFPKILSGKHVGIPDITVFTMQRMRVETEIPMPIYADGEYIGQTPAEIFVCPEILRTVTQAHY